MSDPPPTVQFRVDSRGVAVATLNRPHALNALNRAMVLGLEEVVNEAWDDARIRCLVLTGAGRGFCAGADIKEWASDNGEADDWVAITHRLMSRLYRLPKPVIAAVNGVAVGAGLDLALAADLRLASTTARLGCAYVTIGYCPDAGGTFFLPRLIGETKAKELIFTGRIIDAEEAGRLGCVSAVVEPDALPALVGDWAGRLAAGPTIAIGLAKNNIREGVTLSLERALGNERLAGEVCAGTADAAEGLRAAAEKRQPVFVGH
jgi:enoyl-CoA hydratase/carnithine racemase